MYSFRSHVFDMTQCTSHRKLQKRSETDENSVIVMVLLPPLTAWNYTCLFVCFVANSPGTGVNRAFIRSLFIGSLRALFTAAGRGVWGRLKINCSVCVSAVLWRETGRPALRQGSPVFSDRILDKYGGVWQGGKGYKSGLAGGVVWKFGEQ